MKAMVIGSGGLMDRELVIQLAKIYGERQVIASRFVGSVGQKFDFIQYELLHRYDGDRLEKVICKNRVQHIYLMETPSIQESQDSWNTKMETFYMVIEIARKNKVKQMFWPSSSEIFSSEYNFEDEKQNGLQSSKTPYGIAVGAGEHLCKFYSLELGFDIRCVRFPAIISPYSKPQLGKVNFIIDIIHHAINQIAYSCFLPPKTNLSLLYIQDALNAVINVMSVSKSKITVRNGYNLQAMNVTPNQMELCIKRYFKNFIMEYAPTESQLISQNQPRILDDSSAVKDWGWNPKYNLDKMTEEILSNLL
jgi:nucleoside-diphosphate-sugar epimerase